MTRSPACLSLKQTMDIIEHTNAIFSLSWVQVRTHVHTHMDLERQCMSGGTQLQLHHEDPAFLVLQPLPGNSPATSSSTRDSPSTCSSPLAL